MTAKMASKKAVPTGAKKGGRVTKPKPLPAEAELAAEPQVVRNNLEEFFVVTETSTYRVACFGAGDSPYPYAEKIAVHGESEVLVGHKISGQMIAVAKFLQCFTPEGHGAISPLTSVERRLEMVNTRWWGAGTSKIIALFLTSAEAEACTSQSDLEPCDLRWLEQTKITLAAIGENHPMISICHYRDLGLLEAAGRA